MKFNASNTLLMAEATGDDFAGEGLSARLDAFINQQETTSVDPSTGDLPSTPTPVSQEAPPVMPPVASTKPTDTPTGDSPADEEDDLPTLGSQKKTDPPAANLDFDAQTEAIAKAIEAAGHPGEEYRRLRSELKTLKDRKPIADLDTIPEVKELKIKAAEAEKFKLEAEALRERQKDLLSANDEVAVREGDEFINGVRKPLAEMEKIVGAIAESIEVDAQTLFSIISEPNIAKQDKMLEALHQKVGSRMAGRIERFCDDYKAIEAKSSDLLSNASKNAERARLAREQGLREDAQRKMELFKSSIETSFTSYASRIPGFTDSSGNLTDVAKATMAKTAEVDLESLGADDLGYMAFAANALPEARRAIVALQKELSILKGTRPTPTPIGGNTAKPKDPEDETMGLSDRMKGMEFTFTPPT